MIGALMLAPESVAVVVIVIEEYIKIRELTGIDVV
jgi:hypothetical protein